MWAKLVVEEESACNDGQNITFFLYLYTQKKIRYGKEKYRKSLSEQRYPKISLPTISLQKHCCLSEDQAICCSVSLENPSGTPPSVFCNLPLLSASALLCTERVSQKKEFPDDVSASLLQGIPELKNWF